MNDKIDIKALRERLGWTQGQMAEFLGLDRSSVSRAENGQAVKGPTERLLRQLFDEAEKRALGAGVEAAE